MQSDRALPHDTVAEAAALGALLLDPDAHAGALVRERLTAEAFYQIKHRVIFENITRLLSEGKRVDLVVLSSEMRRQDKIDEIGGDVYLGELVMGVPTTAYTEQHVETLEDCQLRRRVIQHAAKLSAAAYETTEPMENVHALLAEGPKLATQRHEFVTMRAAVLGVMEGIEKIIASPRHITGLSTGFEKIDEYTHGLTAPDVWIIAARPSGGKTAFAMSVAVNACLRENVPVGVITMEQSAKALAKRTLASWSAVNMRRLRFTSPEQQERLTAEAMKIAKLPILFDERPALTVRQIQATGRKMVQREGCKLLMLDYLQLGHADTRTASRNEEVMQLSGGIKAMAKELNVPVILLSQLNRQAGHGNVRPALHHLRDSGAVEQDADIVAFLNLDLEDAELPDAWQGRFNPHELANIAQFDIAKQRDGEVVAAYLRFTREYTRFESLIVPEENDNADRD